jgi:membrane associated rhomboid family serine protease
MRAASVGYQCPDDVADGARSVRQARTTFGGRISGDTSRVTIALIALNVAVFVLGLLLGQRELQARFANVPGAPGLFGVADGEFYRLLTAAFLHAGVFHLAVNMFALASLGPQLETALGRVRYLALYLLSALGGSTLSFLLSPVNTFGVGASGAIFGLFGAYFVIVRRLGGETGAITTLLLINLVITFAVPRIDWRAHLGGLIVGAVIAAAMAYAPRGPQRDRVQGTACGAVLLLLVALIAARQAALSA